MDQIFNEPEAVRQPESSLALISNLQPEAVRQPLRLQSSLAAISNLKLSKEKTNLLKGTVFHTLSTVSSTSQCSGTLINVLIDSYDVQTKSFKFEKSSIKFCAKEVASVLNMDMKGEGKTVDINQLQPHRFESWVLEWRDMGLDGGKLNPSVVLSPGELKKILKDMKVNEDETHNMRCKKLLLYFLLDQFLFSTSSSTPRSCIWQLVEDLDQIDSYNWPQSILDWTHSELARIKHGHAKSKNRTFGSPSPVLEAMLYQRIPIIRPPLNGDPLNIQKFKGVKKSVEDWLVVLSRLEQSDIVPCSCCDDVASDEAHVPFVEEFRQLTMQQANSEPEAVHSGPSFEDEVFGDKAESAGGHSFEMMEHRSPTIHGEASWGAAIVLSAPNLDEDHPSTPQSFRDGGNEDEGKEMEHRSPTIHGEASGGAAIVLSAPNLDKDHPSIPQSFRDGGDEDEGKETEHVDQDVGPSAPSTPSALPKRIVKPPNRLVLSGRKRNNKPKKRKTAKN